MKQFVQLLNEAGFAVCVAFAIILAFFLMISDVVLDIVIRRTSEFSARLVKKRKGLAHSAGPLARLPKSV